jgi:hypothetical protein
MIDVEDRIARFLKASFVALWCCAWVAACSSDSKTRSPAPASASGIVSTVPVAATATPTIEPSLSTVVAAPGISTTEPSTTGSAVTTEAPPTTVAFVPTNADPAQFDASLFATKAPVDNPWLPLTPGYQATKEGAVNKGSRRLPHHRVFTVTDVTKEIAGVRTVLILDQDFDGGELSEQAIDYLAEDSNGNVWYVGSYTEAYEGGQFVNANDAWLAGIDGAKAGVLMMADPKPGMPKYKQATIPDQGTDIAEVVDHGQEVCVPFKCYTDVLVVREGGSENKYFAPGVGEIRLEPISGDPQETEEMVNLTQLTEQGLAEISAEALRLDENARTQAPRVFGESATATRLS